MSGCATARRKNQAADSTDVRGLLSELRSVWLVIGYTRSAGAAAGAVYQSFGATTFGSGGSPS